MIKGIENALHSYIKEYAGLGSVRELVGRAIDYSRGVGLPEDPEELKSYLNKAVDFANSFQNGARPERYPVGRDPDQKIIEKAMRSVSLDAPGVMLASAMNTDIPHFLLPVYAEDIKIYLSQAVDIAISRRTA